MNLRKIDQGMDMAEYNIGDTSPDFSIRLTAGREFNLYSTLNNSSVLINFIRGTWCEECTNHLKKIEKWKHKLCGQNNPIATIIITVEDEAKVNEWIKKNPISYMMAVDPDGHVAKAYGFMVPDDAYSKPGMILLDKNREIRIISDDLKESREQTKKELKIED